ncbi:MAG: Uma2 family endonuclease [Cyanobacteria bacterium P01_E01_bin.42]
MVVTPISTHRWTVEQYHQMIETGILTPRDRVELIRGEIVDVSPQKPVHAVLICLLADLLRERLQGNAYVRSQLPITLSNSEPSPDLAIVRGTARSYLTQHPLPDDIFWLIEVSNTTLAFDLGAKAEVYAIAGIPEYWVFDCQQNRLHLFRNPRSGQYQQEMIISGGENISPIAFPHLTLTIEEFLI